MFKRLKERSRLPEYMDDPTASEVELGHAYRQLRILNRLLGAYAPTVYGVQRLWESGGKPEKLTVYDVGAGSGDVNRHLLKWAAKKRITMHIVLIDPSHAACSEASQLFHDDARVDIKQWNVHELPANAADIVTGTQFIHHFASQELPQIIEPMMRCARLGVVLNDIHRHFIAWAAVWLVTRMISRNRMIVHDGPLSVAKGFRSADWRELSHTLGLDMHVSWRPMFRYAAVIPCNQG